MSAVLSLAVAAVKRAHHTTLDARQRDRLLRIAGMLLVGPVTVDDLHAALWPDTNRPAANKALTRLVKRAKLARVELVVKGAKKHGGQRTVTMRHIGFTAAEMGCEVGS